MTEQRPLQRVCEQAVGRAVGNEALLLVKGLDPADL